MVRNYKRKTEDRWSKEDLLEALTLIKRNELKINDAVRQFGISRATLYRQYQKFLQFGEKYDITQFRTCGGNPILTKVEEDVLEKTINDLRDQGFSVLTSDIKRICYEYCDSNEIPNHFNPEKRMASDDWYYGFLKRHPMLRIPRPGRVELAAPEVKKKKIKGKIRSSKPGTPKASLIILPSGDSGRNKFFDESCESQVILGEIDNAREPDGKTVPIKADVKEENTHPEDADENQPEDMDDMENI